MPFSFQNNVVLYIDEKIAHYINILAMNMKKHLLFLLLCVHFTYFFAQSCTPDTSYTQVGIWPDTLLPGCVGAPYNQSLTIVFPKQITLSGNVQNILSAEIVQSVGLPSSLQWQCGNSNCMYAGGSTGCFSIVGTPDSVGIYPLAFVIQLTVQGLSNAVFDTLTAPALHIVPALTFQVIGINDATCGNQDGSAALYAYGDYPPFGYHWDNGQNGSVAITLPAGIQGIEISNAIGCKYRTLLTIESEGGPIATLTAQPILCAGINSGSIQTQIVSGTPPFSYSWSNGDTTATLSGLAPGNYIVAISDALDCTQIYSETLISPEPLTYTIQSQPCSNLSTPDGSAQMLVSGGVQPYTFSWSNGGVTFDNTHLSPGDYEVWVTDGNGCSVQTMITISLQSSVNTAPNVTFSIIPNPALDNFSLTSAGLLLVEIQVFDNLGNRIFYMQDNITALNLSTAQWVEGFYWVMIRDSEGRVGKKCLVVGR